MLTRSRLIRLGFVLLWSAGLFLVCATLAAAAPPPVRIGLTAEFGVRGSHAAQSIERGILLALDEINAAGGVLDGRPLLLETRDDRGLPARGADHYADFAARDDIVAVFCGRFSPVALEIAQGAGRHGLVLLDPWAAADPITAAPAGAPNFVFRLSLTDSWAMRALLDHARGQGWRRLALFVPNTAWGRSNEAALLAYLRRHPELRHETIWYNWGDSAFAARLAQARAARSQALLLVANEAEGLAILREMAALPEAERLPVLSHWGVLGGDFGRLAAPYLDGLDFVVAHTFSFSDPHGARARAVAEAFAARFGQPVDALRAQVGFAHAYDLTHLLARAIRKAGSTDRAAIRAALERLDPYDGLVRRYARPFTAARHEALAPADVRLARFARDGSLRSIERR